MFKNERKRLPIILLVSNIWQTPRLFLGVHIILIENIVQCTYKLPKENVLSSFLGISIISDIFMCAIEKITSKTTEIQIAGDADSPSDVIEVAVYL